LLKGLEISVLNLSEVRNSIEDFRIHSEFFKKEFLNNEIKLKSFNSKPLSTYSKISDGDHSKFPDNQKREVRYLQARDINNNFLEITSDVFVSKTYLEKNKRSLLKGEDILLSIMGTVGDITILPKGFKPAMCNRALAIIKNIKGISPQFLFSYLTTKFAFIEIERLKNGGVQQRLNLDVLNKLRIPNLGVEFQKMIEITVLKAQETRLLSKQSYTKAETLLLEEIGLQDFTPSKEPVNIKSFKDSFGTSGRLDAEYYQKKYEDIENKIHKTKNGFTTISNEFEQITLKSKKDKIGYNYIEISDVNVSTGSCNSNFIKTNELPANAKTLVKKGDILISKVRPYRGAVTLINFEKEDLIVSGAFTVLREKEKSIFSNEVLKVLLRTKEYKELLLKFNVGTSYPVIKDIDVLNLPIPKISKDTQEEITSKIQHSSKLKKQSEHLLEVAKKAVEIAIEEDEEVALKFINSQTS